MKKVWICRFSRNANSDGDKSITVLKISVDFHDSKSTLIFAGTQRIFYHILEDGDGTHETKALVQRASLCVPGAAYHMC